MVIPAATIGDPGDFVVAMLEANGGTNGGRGMSNRRPRYRQRAPATSDNPQHGRPPANLLLNGTQNASRPSCSPKSHPKTTQTAMEELAEGFFMLFRVDRTDVAVILGVAE